MSRTIAAVFPGQGSQSAGMLAELAADWSEVEATFAEASDALDYDLWALVRDDTDGAVNRTEITQPAMLAAGVASARVWRAAGGEAPALVAGHSLGEFTALVAAGVLDFADAVRLVAVRARLMQDAVPEGVGGMAAILGLDDETVAGICAAASAGRVVGPANFNAPGQVVIAGHADAVQEALEAAREAGAKKARDLPVSVPSHSPLMEEAAAEFGAVLDGVAFRAPAVPVIQNVDAAAHDDTDAIREALRRQLHNPVQWTASMRALQTAGADAMIELGPGKVLAGLARRIDRRLPAAPVFDPPSLTKARAICEGEAA